MIFFKAPKFWQNKNSKILKFLDPILKFYLMICVIKNKTTKAEKLSVPVVCVNDIVLGGAGKTLAANLIFRLLKDKGHNPHMISSGYGGYLKNVVMVDKRMHSYLQVGDDALMLSSFAPTWIGKNKINAGKAAIASKADVIIMNEQRPNTTVEKNLKILVIDANQGFGNEHVFPAGPLREPIDPGVKNFDAALIIGEKNEYIETLITKIKPEIQIFYALIKISDVALPAGSRIIGFCGLGYPTKFKKTLQELDFEVIDFVSFSDHHPYTITEIQKLLKAAETTNAKLVTTRKDFIKIPDVFKPNVTVVDVFLSLPDERFENLLAQKLSDFETKISKPEDIILENNK